MANTTNKGAASKQEAAQKDEVGFRDSRYALKTRSLLSRQ